DAVTFPATGTSEDIAMLLADEKGASLIVAVGTHATLVEFLDKGRGGMASTFLTRLRVGGKLIDAKGVSRLYQSRISSGALLLLVLAAMIAIGATLAVSTAGQTYLDIFGDKWDRFVDWLQGIFT
ncbi:MAG: thiamine pyrophosphokinae, catalytic region, partial [Pseudonocardiales bacterium]|nr:thiamine pyrophosphokinae, catalytic region [Pseudonocardiales bacterium]